MRIRLYVRMRTFYSVAMNLFCQPRMLLNLCRSSVFCAMLATGGACADTLIPPQGRLERGIVVPFVYRADPASASPASASPASGKLTLDWTDALGRKVQHWVMSVRLAKDGSVSVPVDLSRVVATSNTIRGSL